MKSLGIIFLIFFTLSSCDSSREATAQGILENIEAILQDVQAKTKLEIDNFSYEDWLDHVLDVERAGNEAKSALEYVKEKLMISNRN